MSNWLQEARERRDEGFTLIELLIVIVILGILAGVVVFSVRGLNDKGQTAACKEDTRTLETAEEAYLAKPSSAGDYTNMAGLVTAGLLNSASTYHTLAFTPHTSTVPASFIVSEATPSPCGASGVAVDGTTNL